MDPGLSRIILTFIVLALLMGMCSVGTNVRGGSGSRGTNSDYERCLRSKPIAHQWECDIK